MTKQIREGVLVKIFPTKVWIESGIFGERVVMIQHEGCEPFEYAVFNYNHRYTSNSMTMNTAVAVAMSLGAEDPVEHRHRPIPEMPTEDEVRKKISDWEKLLASMQRAKSKD